MKEIDKKCAEISERTGKRYTRSHYTNALIENDCEQQYKKYKEERFEKSLEKFAVSLHRQEQKLQEYIDVTGEMVGMLLEKNT